jgi:hypothetical protein
MFAAASIFFLAYRKAVHWTSKNKVGTAIPLVSDTVMTQSSNQQKNKI